MRSSPANDLTGSNIRIGQHLPFQARGKLSSRTVIGRHLVNKTQSPSPTHRGMNASATVRGEKQGDNGFGRTGSHGHAKFRWPARRQVITLPSPRNGKAQ